MSIEVLTAGIAVGVCYAVIASAVTIAAVATRTLHLAIGTVAAAGLVVTLGASVSEVTGIPAPVGLLVGMAVGGLLSAGVYLAAAWRRADPTTVLVGIVVAAALVDAALAALGSGRSVRPDPLIASDVLPPTAVAVGIGLLVAVGLQALLRATRFGRRLRIAGASVPTAERLGIRVTGIRVAAFGIAGAAATLAAVLAAPILTFGPAQAAALTVRGVAAAAIATGGPVGAIVGGVGLGIAEVLGQRLWPAAGGPTVVTVVVIGILVVRGAEAARQWGRSW
jgi:branched-chain amino acid transport system permease protein